MEGGALGFWGGMKYSENKRTSFRDLIPGQGQQRGQQFGNFGNRSGQDFIAGEIISKDDKSVTIKLRDGGSKIVFYSAQTEISKFAKGEIADLQIGNNVLISGKAGADGSFIAQTIQLRPTIRMPLQR